MCFPTNKQRRFPFCPSRLLIFNYTNIRRKYIITNCLNRKGCVWGVLWCVAVCCGVLSSCRIHLSGHLRRICSYKNFRKECGTFALLTGKNIVRHISWFWPLGTIFHPELIRRRHWPLLTGVTGNLHYRSQNFQRHEALTNIFLKWQGNFTRVGTLIVATIYLQLIQNRYMFRSFTVLKCSHQHCVQPVTSDVEVVGYL